MIHLPPNPRKLLIIDDHAEWLDSLKQLNCNVLDCKSRSYRSIVDFIVGAGEPFEMIIINLNLLQTTGDNREDAKGKRVYDVLIGSFPTTPLALTSFIKTAAPEARLDYIDLLQQLRNTYGAQ